jgi:hypothetical protein
MKKQFRPGSKSRLLNFTCTEEEYQKILEQYRNTTDRSLSAYARKMLLGKPVTINYRDRSMDDLIDTLAGLQTTLETIIEKKDWDPRKVAELFGLLKDIKSVTYKIAEVCVPKSN